MNMRQIRCFIAVAEELNFSRAAERLHIEQSPLSRSIKKLEANLGVTLLERTSRGTRLTWPGQVFLEDARRIVLAVDRAKGNARSAAAGFRGTLRIAVSNGIARTRISALLALCREEEPEVEVRLIETHFSLHLKGLADNLFDAGLALSDQVEASIVAEPVWRDPLMVAVPAKHPLLAHKFVPLNEAMAHPLVLCDPASCEGCSTPVGRLMSEADAQPVIAEHAASHDLMLALVAAGYGVGFSSTAHLAAYRMGDIVARPLAGNPDLLTTYLLRPQGQPSAQLRSFIDRAVRIGARSASHPPSVGTRRLDADTAQANQCAEA